MRKTLIALAACGLVGAACITGITAADAQAPGAPPPPPPPGMDGGPPRGMHHPMGACLGGPEGMRHMGGMFQRMRAFALIYPSQDRALSGADVQKIAEAFLLFNGNHTWKVTEVAEQPDAISFALATPDNTAIAHFTMDRHTARLARVN